MLCGLEKEAKRTLRNVLAHDVIETQIKMENSSRNMEDCAENVNIFNGEIKRKITWGDFRGNAVINIPSFSDESF